MVLSETDRFGFKTIDVLFLFVSVSRSVSVFLVVIIFFCFSHRLVGLVVKASASRAEDPGFESRWRRDFFGVESYQ